MKKALLIMLLLILLILNSQGNLVIANTPTDLEEDVQNEEIIIEDLFLKRISLWNGMYDNNYDTKSFEKELKMIAEEPLLSYDIEYFEEIKSAPTDIDKVLNFSLLDVENISYGRSTMNATIKTLWEMQGQESYYYEEIDYDIKLLKESDGWKLLDFDVTQ